MTIGEFVTQYTSCNDRFAYARARHQGVPYKLKESIINFFKN